MQKLENTSETLERAQRRTQKRDVIGKSILSIKMTPGLRWDVAPKQSRVFRSRQSDHRMGFRHVTSPRARSRVRDGRGCLFGAFSPHGTRLATARRFDETCGRTHLQNRGAGGLDLADDPLAMDEFLTRVRRCGRGLTRGGKKRAHLPGVALSPLSWETASNGQRTRASSPVCLWPAMIPDYTPNDCLSRASSPYPPPSRREHIQKLLEPDEDLLDLLGRSEVRHGVGE